MTELTAKKHFVRWMVRRDMPEVLEIEKSCFEIPWDKDDFRGFLDTRNCIGMIAEHEDRVAGFMTYEILKSKFYLHSIAVHPGCRRQGIGSEMVLKLIGKLGTHGRNRIEAGVRETNLSALMFLRANGFRAAQIIKDCYPGTNDDMYLMRYKMRNK